MKYAVSIKRRMFYIAVIERKDALLGGHCIKGCFAWLLGYWRTFHLMIIVPLVLYLYVQYFSGGRGGPVYSWFRPQIRSFFVSNKVLRQRRWEGAWLLTTTFAFHSYTFVHCKKCQQHNGRNQPTAWMVPPPSTPGNRTMLNHCMLFIPACCPRDGRKDGQTERRGQHDKMMTSFSSIHDSGRRKERPKPTWTAGRRWINSAQQW
jgi:hypothetical protein